MASIKNKYRNSSLWIVSSLLWIERVISLAAIPDNIKKWTSLTSNIPSGTLWFLCGALSASTIIASYPYIRSRIFRLKDYLYRLTFPVLGIPIDVEFTPEGEDQPISEVSIRIKEGKSKYLEASTIRDFFRKKENLNKNVQIGFMTLYPINLEFELSPKSNNIKHNRKIDMFARTRSSEMTHYILSPFKGNDLLFYNIKVSASAYQNI